MEKEINEFGEFVEGSNFIQKSLFTIDDLENADCKRLEIPVGVKVIGRNAFDYKTKIEDGTITEQEMYDFYDVYKEFAKDISVIEFEILQQLAFMGMLLRFQKVC